MKHSVIAVCEVFRIQHAGKMSPSLDGFELAAQYLTDIGAPGNRITGYVPAVGGFFGSNKGLQEILFTAAGSTTESGLGFSVRNSPKASLKSKILLSAISVTLVVFPAFCLF